MFVWSIATTTIETYAIDSDCGIEATLEDAKQTATKVLEAQLDSYCDPDENETWKYYRCERNGWRPSGPKSNCHQWGMYKLDGNEDLSAEFQVVIKEV